MLTIEGHVVFCPHCKRYVDQKAACKSREEAVMNSCKNLIDNFRATLKI